MTGDRSHATEAEAALQPDAATRASGLLSPTFSPAASRTSALSPPAILALQRAAGNRAVSRAIRSRGAAIQRGTRLDATLLQRDPADPVPFTPAPAPPWSPPPPPVPGSAAAVRDVAFKIGLAAGGVLADIQSALDQMQTKRGDLGGARVWDRMSAEDKATFARESAARFDNLPQVRRVEAPELAAAQEEGFNAGVDAGVEMGKVRTFLEHLGADIAMILITAIATAGVGLLPRLLMRLVGRGQAIIFGGVGDTITLFRYAKVAEDVAPSGWWTTRQAATRAEAARLTGVPENECLFEQQVTVNASPSKYEPYFASQTPRAVGESLVEEFKNKVLIPKTAMTVRPMPQ